MRERLGPLDGLRGIAITLVVWLTSTPYRKRDFSASTCSFSQRLLLVLSLCARDVRREAGARGRRVRVPACAEDSAVVPACNRRAVERRRALRVGERCGTADRAAPVLRARVVRRQLRVDQRRALVECNRSAVLPGLSDACVGGAPLRRCDVPGPRGHRQRLSNRRARRVRCRAPHQPAARSLGPLRARNVRRVGVLRRRRALSGCSGSPPRVDRAFVCRRRRYRRDHRNDVWGEASTRVAVGMACVGASRTRGRARLRDPRRAAGRPGLATGARKSAARLPVAGFIQSLPVARGRRARAVGSAHPKLACCGLPRRCCLGLGVHSRRGGCCSRRCVARNVRRRTAAAARASVRVAIRTRRGECRRATSIARCRRYLLAPGVLLAPYRVGELEEGREALHAAQFTSVTDSSGADVEKLPV